MKSLVTLAVASFLLGLTLVAQDSSPAQSLFQRGLLLERAEGNVAQAIVLYERVVAEHPDDRIVVPQALYHLARLYEPSDPPRAARMWSRIVSDFGQTQYADEARRKTATLQAQATGPFSMRSLESVLNGQGLDYYNCNGCDVSPDGRAVAWVKEGPTEQVLLVRDLDSGRERTILTERIQNLEDVDWSRDGLSLSFRTSPKQGPTAGQARELRVLTPAGRPVRSFTIPEAMGPIRSYLWTADNQRIVAFLSQTGAGPQGLQILDVATGATRFLSGGTVWAWSPDGKQIFYVVPNPQQGDKFFVANVENGQTREVPIQLKVTGAADRINIATGVTQGRAWVTRDQVLVRQLEPGGASFYLVKVADGSVTKTCRMTDPAAVTAAQRRRCHQLTPDGRLQLAEDVTSRRIMVIDIAAGTERRLTSGFGDEESPVLSPDGKLVAFLSNPDGKWALFVAPVDQAPVAAPVRMGVLDEYPTSGAFSLAWSRDGRLVIESDFDDENIYRINMDRTGRPTGPAGRLTQDSMYASSPVVSPDSNRVAYRFTSGQKQGIAVMSADGAGERPVLEVVGPEHLEWLSAEEVLFNKPQSTGGPMTVTVLNVNTGATRPFADVTDPFGWQYVPSRSELVYVQGDLNGPSRTIRARSLKDGAERTIITVDQMLNFRYTFRVSPDGQRIAYGRWIGEGSSRRAEMRLVSIDGRDDRVLTTSPWTQARPSGFPYSWSPDGRLLLYDAAPGVVTVMDVQTGATWPIAEATDGDGHEWAGAQWAPDGGFIVLFRSGWRGEYRLFQGVTYDAVTKLMAAPARSGR